MDSKIELNEGEKLAFSVKLPDGKTIHTILLHGEIKASWEKAMEWAKSVGGDLPDRAEQALFFKYMPEEFKKEAHWSNTLHAEVSYYAWYQGFDNGSQRGSLINGKLRARAVRRLII